MARKKGMSHLNVSIKYDKVHKCYCTVMDGDVFYSDNYDHAIIQLIYLLSRDEFSKSKIH